MYVRYTFFTEIRFFIQGSRINSVSSHATFHKFASSKSLTTYLPDAKTLHFKLPHYEPVSVMLGTSMKPDI